MDEKTLLTGVLTKTLNMTDEEVADLLYQKSDENDEVTLNEDALHLVLDRDVKRIDNVKKNVKPDKDRLSGEYSRGVKEGMEKFEQTLRTKYGVESTSQGLDLVQEAVDAVSECNMELTDDKVKAYPLYRTLEENSVPRKDYETKSQELEDFKSNQDKSTRFGKVKSDVLVLTDELKPIISESATVAKTRQVDYLNKFEAYDYELKDDGNHFVMKDGKRIEDAHGNPIKFVEHVAKIAGSCYEFQVSDDRGQAGNRDTGGSTQVTVPKNEIDYRKQMAELMQKGDREGTVALRQAWEALQKK